MFRKGLIQFTQNLKTAVDLLKQIAIWANGNTVDKDEMDIEFTSLHGKIRIMVDFAPNTIYITQINSLCDHIRKNFDFSFHIDERIASNLSSKDNKNPLAYSYQGDYFTIVLVTSNILL